MIMMMLTLAGMLLTVCHAQNLATGSITGTETLAKTMAPVAKWDKTTEEMGQIPQGIPRVAEFLLTNDGNEPLLISFAQASCGCTNLNYSREPLLPANPPQSLQPITQLQKVRSPNRSLSGPMRGEQPVILVIKGNVCGETGRTGHSSAPVISTILSRQRKLLRRSLFPG